MREVRLKVQGNVLGRVLRTAAILALAGGLSACDKGNEAGCFTSTGNIVTERRVLAPFHVLTTYDNIAVVLVQDTATYAEVRAGKNLQDDIRLEVSGSELVVRNTSRCNWVRRYDTPREVTLHLPHLTDIYLRGQADIRTQGAFRQDTIFPHLVGAGDFHLNLLSRYVGLSQYELGDIYLSGATDELHHILGGSGSLYAQGFPLRNAYLQTNFDSNGNMHLRPGRLLAGTHAGTGTIFYSAPTSLQQLLKVTGKGKLQAE
ncbi:GIN domain-containing protein [Hymenobacter rubripertinctus]|uniref:Putative auto-transporter adhesin head GIN domain-containing protein n=1 Tax=Hymenobacter rubripertinctus TaxID=2029981 RepID=A0A418QPX5_9BACT|nr:DUF2807 domain-containing protein [Hymenobacter rubripertinctus]RIY07172.1 hypothetical protein D0T11_17360 [Hymenobacter rubripertinctus]